MSELGSLISIFESTNYTQILASAIARKKISQPKFSVTTLAKSCGIQVSYLSGVLNGKFHLNQDQLYLICAELELEDQEKDYLSHLLEWSRSANHQRKKLLRRRIDEARSRRLSVEETVKMKSATAPMAEAAYYLDPFVAIVHMYLEDSKAKHGIGDIARALRLTQTRVRAVLVILETLGLIAKKGERWTVKVNELHLSQESPMAKIHHLGLRVLGLERMISLPARDFYSFGVTMNLSEESVMAIRAEFLKFIKKTKKLVEDSPTGQVMQLQFDLFPWMEIADADGK